MDASCLMGRRKTTFKRRLLGWLVVCLFVASGRLAVAEGGETGGDRPIFLRVQLSEDAVLAVYLKCSVVSWQGRWRTVHKCILSGLPATEHIPSGSGQYIQPGDSSPWIELTPYLAEGWKNRVNLSLQPRLNSLETNVRVQIATRPGNAYIVKTMPVPFTPERRLFTLMLNRDLEEGTAKSFFDMAKETNKKAQQELAKHVVHGKRPEKFPCFTPLQVDKREYPDAWDRELMTLELLGMNGVYNQMGPDLEARGFVRNGVHGFFFPYFPTAEDADRWGDRISREISVQEGWDNVSTVKIFEECGGPSFTALLNGDKRHSADFYRAEFVKYLKGKGVTLAGLSKNDWAELRIVDREEASAEPRLFYHSMLFRPWVLANSINLTGKAMARHFKEPLAAPIDTSDAYIYTGYMLRQGVNLLHWVRESEEVNDMGISSWLNDSATYQLVSYKMEIIRCGTRYKRSPQLMLTAIGVKDPTDILFAVFSGLAHGLDEIWWFSYGPWYAANDHFSDRPCVFPAVEKINYAIGAAEDLLVSSEPRPAEVAILYSLASEVWGYARDEKDTKLVADRAGVFLSLLHDQIPVEILCDEDVVRGELDKFHILYVAGENITAAAARKIRPWVEKGGVLVGTAGTATRDEYNARLTVLDDVFGVARGEIQRAPKVVPSGKLDELTPYDTVTDMIVAFVVSGNREHIHPAGGTTKTIATFYGNDSPAITENGFGRGKAYAYAYTPGVSYLRDGLTHKRKHPAFYKESYSPAVYSAAMRALINRPVKERGIRTPVDVDIPVIETGLRENEKGAVVTLVNYPRKPVRDLKVKVRGIEFAKIASVRSAVQGEDLPFEKADDGTVEIVTDLDLVDMLLLRFRGVGSD